MKFFKKHKEMAKSVELNCFQCGQKIGVVSEGALLIYTTDSVERAKAYGFNGYCKKCKLAFCSEHSNWKVVVPRVAYSSFCPICGNPLGGYR